MKSWSGSWCGIAWLAAMGAAGAQELPPPTSWSEGPAAIACVVQHPPGFVAEKFVPLAVLFGAAQDEAGVKATLVAHGSDLARAGFVVVAPILCRPWDVPGPRLGADTGRLFHALRQRFRVEQGGLHAVVAGGAERAIAVVQAQRVEFQTITVCGEAASADVAALRRLPARRVHSLPSSDPATVAAHVQKLHAERNLPGVAGEVAKVLDDFHDAAAVGDEKRYFAILPDDALFLGTDGTERWTGAEFRKFALPYFERDSAWTYVCLRRHVDVDAGGAFAWFDETFDNAAYGECRGSGVMQKRDGRWVLRQYHLTVPVPNDVTRAVAARIRAFQDQVSVPETTIILVRHAEKVDESADAALNEAGRRRAENLAMVLRDLRIDVIYASGRQRANQTVQPTAQARGLTSRTEANPARMVQLLQGELAGRTVLVCGHSNTVPEMLQRLGITERVTIGDAEFDRLFVVTLAADGPRLLSLRY